VLFLKEETKKEARMRVRQEGAMFDDGEFQDVFSLSFIASYRQLEAPKTTDEKRTRHKGFERKQTRSVAASLDMENDWTGQRRNTLPTNNMVK
jgi:hypothetical protein